MPKPSVSRESFAAIAATTGLKLNEAETRELYEAYGHVEAMVARLRGAKRAPAAEPAVVFKPER
jgi:hypothetical protein